MGLESDLYGGYDVDVVLVHADYEAPLDFVLSTALGPAWQRKLERANAVVWRIGTQSTDVDPCTQQVLPPGTAGLVSAFSLYNLSGNYWVTAGAVTAKYGLLGLGYALGNTTLTTAGAGVGIASAVATGVATAIEARARYQCGQPIVP